MALSPADAARAFVQAIGLVGEATARLRDAGRAGDPVVPGNMARRLLANNPAVPGRNFASYLAVARRAIASSRAAELMANNPQRASTVRELPVTPSLLPTDQRFHYRAVVITRDDTLMSVERAITVTSDVALTWEEVQQRIADRLDFWESARMSTRDSLARMGASAVDVAVTLVAAYRTR